MFSSKYDNNYINFYRTLIILFILNDYNRKLYSIDYFGNANDRSTFYSGKLYGFPFERQHVYICLFFFLFFLSV